MKYKVCTFEGVRYATPEEFVHDFLDDMTINEIRKILCGETIALAITDHMVSVAIVATSE